MDLDEWVGHAPEALKAEPIWKVRAFQIGSFAASLASRDALVLGRQARFAELGAQLVRAAGSIAANVAEGYTRQSRKERIKYYEYALGSANEAKTWYTTAADALSPAELDERLTYLARISHLLLTMIRNERDGLSRNSLTRIP